ncbi:hypothetical protein FALBO_12763 [Fusarium albosuccineum]|uniref:Ubiquitin-like protease family profile domain-containing protein n=1 Tax=Fusarium albosuccineum TaxID=1237068 RepID=A0A8H4PGW9_9HYPO|nr:hypothetical protein FALBO_12763 [Fusarium albosuccineum]
MSATPRSIRLDADASNNITVGQSPVRFQPGTAACNVARRELAEDGPLSPCTIDLLIKQCFKPPTDAVTVLGTDHFIAGNRLPYGNVFIAPFQRQPGSKGHWTLVRVHRNSVKRHMSVHFYDPIKNDTRYKVTRSIVQNYINSQYQGWTFRFSQMPGGPSAVDSTSSGIYIVLAAEELGRQVGEGAILPEGWANRDIRSHLVSAVNRYEDGNSLTTSPRNKDCGTCLDTVPSTPSNRVTRQTLTSTLRPPSSQGPGTQSTGKAIEKHGHPDTNPCFPSSITTWEEFKNTQRASSPARSTPRPQKRPSSEVSQGESRGSSSERTPKRRRDTNSQSCSSTTSLTAYGKLQIIQSCMGSVSFDPLRVLESKRTSLNDELNKLQEQFSSSQSAVTSCKETRSRREQELNSAKEKSKELQVSIEDDNKLSSTWFMQTLESMPAFKTLRRENLRQSLGAALDDSKQADQDDLDKKSKEATVAAEDTLNEASEAYNKAFQKCAETERVVGDKKKEARAAERMEELAKSFLDFDGKLKAIRERWDSEGKAV